MGNPLPFTPRPRHLPYRPGVGIVAVNEQGLILMGECRGFSNIWKMPQGGIETGETPQQAAKRELKEESGIVHVMAWKIAKQQFAYDYPNDERYIPGFKGQEFTWFLAHVTSQILDATSFTPADEQPEFLNLRWVTAKQALSLAHNKNSGDCVTYQRLNMYKNVLSAFALLAPTVPTLPKNQRSKTRLNTKRTFD